VWTNHGTRTHRIASNKGVLPTFAFSLGPATSQRIPFTRTGRYPYSEDGAVQGTVVVVAAAGSPATPVGAVPEQEASSAPVADCRHPPIYYYDVRIKAQLTLDAQLRNGKGDTVPGSFKHTIDWKAHWSKFPLTVAHCENYVEFTAYNDTSGDFDYASTWNDTTQIFSDFTVPACRFATSYHTKGLASFLGLFYQKGRANFSFTGGRFNSLAAPFSGHDETYAELHQCPHHEDGGKVLSDEHSGAPTDIRGPRDSSGTSPWFTPSLRPVGGVDFAANATNAALFIRNATSPPVPFPLGVLSAARDFTFDSGEQSASYSDRGNPGAFGNLTTRVTVTFARVPGV
jgi:hypothetical protein